MSGAEGRTYLADTAWTYADVAWVFVAGVVTSIVAAGIAFGLGGDDLDSVVLLAVAVPAQLAGHLAVVARLSRTRGTGRWRDDFGFVIRSRDWSFFFLGALLQVVLVGVLVGVAELIRVEELPTQAVGDALGAVTGWVPRLVAAAFVVIAAPVVEEIIFRGMLLSRLLRSMSATAAVVMSGFVFAAVHVVLDPSSWFVSIALFPLGIVLGSLALSSGALSRPIMAHSGVNGLAAIGLLFPAQIGAAVWSPHVDAFVHLVTG